jgi:hypothetical protein
MEGLHKYTGFPIVEDPTEYKALSAGKVKGMNQTAIDKIEALKPYKGGNDALWKIHRLNITDKHQLLLAVGSIHSDIIVDLSDEGERCQAGHVTSPCPLLKSSPEFKPAFV